MLDGFARGLSDHVRQGLVVAGPAPLVDAGALLDPLVARVDHRAHLFVGHDAVRQVGADTSDPRAGASGPDGEGSGHARSSWTVVEDGCRRSSGWPGDTGSSSSTSHSRTTPPYCAATGISSRRFVTPTMTECAGSVSSTLIEALREKRRLPGETTSRQLGVVDRS